MYFFWSVKIVQKFSDYRFVKLLKYKKKGRLQVGKRLKVFIECQITSCEKLEKVKNLADYQAWKGWKYPKKANLGGGAGLIIHQPFINTQVKTISAVEI